MKRINFISIHLVNKIKELVKKKQAELKHEGFYYFDKPIKDGKKIINRVNIFAPYHKEQILPASWYSLDGSALLDIFLKLRDNQFYIYKRINGKDYKVRLKK
jgi:hypothetical protein